MLHSKVQKHRCKQPVYLSFFYQRREACPVREHKLCVLRISNDTEYYKDKDIDRHDCKICFFSCFQKCSQLIHRFFFLSFSVCYRVEFTHPIELYYTARIRKSNYLHFEKFFCMMKQLQITAYVLIHRRRSRIL